MQLLVRNVANVCFAAVVGNDGGIFEGGHIDHVALFATFVGDVADIGLGVFAAGNNGGIFNRGHIDNFALFAPLAAASLSGVVRGAGGKGRGGVWPPQTEQVCAS